MLTISPVRNISYYTDLAKEDYYLDGGEPNGEWTGVGARLIGLTDSVETNDYLNIMRGHTPDGRYALRQQSSLKQRAGWDLTFSAPKSVSIAWARADKELKIRIQKAHRQAVLKAVEKLEQHAGYTRIGKNGIQQERTTGLVASLFEHATSREQDPQLHTHCLIANVAPRNDGSWGTIDSRHFYLWQKAIGTSYRAELAYQLCSLGFEIERDKESFKLPCIPQSICDLYSKRSKEIKAELSKYGTKSSSSKAGDIAVLTTRNKKENVARNTLYQQWHQELDLLNLSTENLLTNIVNENKPENIQVEHGNPELSAQLLAEKLGESKSSFTQQEVYRQANELAQCSTGGIYIAELIARSFIDDEKTIELGLDLKGRQLFTTTSILEMETQMISLAKDLASKKSFNLTENIIKSNMEQHHFQLSEEQQEAVHQACQPSCLSILQGSAGAGKSASMDVVRRIYQQSGYQVIGASIAKSAANNLALEANIETHTVAKLIKDVENKRMALSNKLILIDEAGQVSTKDLLKLIKLSTQHNCKLLLVGEDKQLDAIEHAGALRYLSRPEVIGTTRIETIRRQRAEWSKKVVADLRDGRSLQALNELDNRGLVDFSTDAETAKNALIKKWNRYRKSQPNKQSLLLAHKWSDVMDLNAKARGALQAEGRLQAQQVKMKCAISNKVFTQQFAIGEKIRLTKNDYKMGLTNGDLGTVTNIVTGQDGETVFEVLLDSGKQLNINTSSYCSSEGNCYIAQAYAMTVYSSQGLTIDGDTFIYYTSGMDRANSYVAGSRHKDNSHWFFNSKELVPNEEVDIKSLTKKHFLNKASKTMSLHSKTILANALHESQPSLPRALMERS
ncbi:MobF family relaxase [Shewanella halotolerans]|uniref:MobF family relaxase n=1 Tax=Shewanella halotolerans TaxID=2864204 RepID=UPI001C65E48E|nr:MobF family relaxase [Shewanella halotolerans]QYJ89671.1 relaxase domain-containing protein [Shewanella halotolerans]